MSKKDMLHEFQKYSHSILCHCHNSVADLIQPRHVKNVKKNSWTVLWRGWYPFREWCEHKLYPFMLLKESSWLKRKGEKGNCLINKKIRVNTHNENLPPKPTSSHVAASNHHLYIHANVRKRVDFPNRIDYLVTFNKRYFYGWRKKFFRDFSQ